MDGPPLETWEEGLQGVDHRLTGLEDTVDEIKNMMIEFKRHFVAHGKQHQGERSTHTSSPDDSESDNRSGGSRLEWQKKENPIRRIEAPVLSGTDPEDWIARIERFFDLNQTPEEDRLSAVPLCVEGQAVKWVRYRSRIWPFTTWPDFKKEVLRRFGTRQRRSPEEEMKALRQTTTVLAYRNRFEDLVPEVAQPTLSWLMGMFLAGLDGVIRAEVDMHQCETLDQLMDLAQAIEQKNKAMSGLQEDTIVNSVANKSNNGGWTSSGVDRSNSQPNNDTKAENMSAASVTGANKTDKVRDIGVASGASKIHSFKRLSNEEFAAKKALGVCARCDGPWGKNHQCPLKELKILIAQEDDHDAAAVLVGEKKGATVELLTYEQIELFYLQGSTFRPP